MAISPFVLPSRQAQREEFTPSISQTSDSTKIRAAAKARSLANIETTLASEDDPRLTRPVDLIFMCNTNHHLPMRIAYLSKLKQHLLPKGRIAIVELAAHRTDPAVIRREMKSAGYVLSDTHHILEYQSFQGFRKSPGE